MDSRQIPQPDPEMTPGANPPAEDVELTPQQWFMQNGPILLLLLGLLVYLYIQFGVTGLLSIGKAAVGLGLVIFIHELGHFLVAKWCDVHVQVFSIGFGPAIPGCSYQWGETTYKLALFPLGGYVQMVGQVDGSEESDGSEDDPRSYRNKSVWQRMAIISAGVVMNVLLAILCFVLVFQGPGKRRVTAIIGTVDSGSPSFTEGLRSNAAILQAGDVKNPFFEDLTFAVMRWYGYEMPLVYQRPGEDRVSVSIQPQLSEQNGRPVIGIASPPSLQLRKEAETPKDWQQPVMPGSVAGQGDRAFAFGDRIIATTDPADPSKVTELPLDPRQPGSKQHDYFAFAQRMQLLADRDVTIRVLRDEDTEKPTQVDIRVPPAYHRTLGAIMAMGEITGVRKNSPAAKAGIQLPDKSKEIAGDVILQVSVQEPDGRLTRFTDNPRRKAQDDALDLVAAVFLPLEVRALALHQALVTEQPLDPLRLPDQLRAWAQRMQAAQVPLEDWKVTLHIQRNNQAPGIQYQYQTLVLPWDRDWHFDAVVPVYSSSPLAIPELGLAYQVKATVRALDPRLAPAGADHLQPGDVIKEITFHYRAKAGEANSEEMKLEVKPDQWAYIFMERLQSASIQKVTLKVNRGQGEDKNPSITLEPQLVKDWPLDTRGFLFRPDTRIQKASDFFDAVALGMRDTHNQVMNVFWTLRGILTGSIAPNKTIGGPVLIASAAYKIADTNFWELVFFLGMISINLAVINFLPIPVLDGGHMVFLLYEAIRGKPASERIRVGATFAGLIFIATLMLAVLYLDISRLFL